MSTAVLPFAHYRAACDAVRALDGSQELIRSGQLALRIQALLERFAGPALAGEITFSGSQLRIGAFSGSGITAFTGNSIVQIQGNGQQGAVFAASALREIHMAAYEGAGSGGGGDAMFQRCAQLQTVDLPRLKYVAYLMFNACTSLERVSFQNCVTVGSETFSNCTALKAVDLGPNTKLSGSYILRNCAALEALILRGTTVTPIGAGTSFTGSPFWSNGGGSVIYIPKLLYDRLGDGSALDYRADANWSILDGYGKITWRPIEGSVYETRYADGTEVGQ